MPNGFSWTRAVTTAALAGCLLFASRATLAQTTELEPGDSVTPPPVLGAPLGGTLVDFLISPFDEEFNGQTISGNVISAVYENGVAEDDVFGGASYDFYYQIEFTGGNSVITGINPASFLGLRTSLGQISDGDVDGVLVPGSESSAQGRRTIDGEGINFDFVGFTPGETSFSLVVRTNATDSSRSGSMGILGSGVTATVLTLAPIAFGGEVAPEPGALGLLALGSVAFVALRRRRS